MVYHETKFGDFQASRREVSELLETQGFPSKGASISPEPSHVLLAVSHISLTEPYVTVKQVLALTSLAERTVQAALKQFTDCNLFLRQIDAEKMSRGFNDIYIATQTGEIALETFQQDRRIVDSPSGIAVYHEATFGDFQTSRREVTELLKTQGFESKRSGMVFDDAHVLLTASYLLRRKPYVTVPAIAALTHTPRRSVLSSIIRFEQYNLFTHQNETEKRPGRGQPSATYKATQTGEIALVAFQKGARGKGSKS
jgi:hypothetical protein